MIYLDYSATTPVDEDVLNTYLKVSKKYIGNVNSLHKLGIESKKLQDRATEQIADLLHVKPSEIIYTSGASESNNMAIKGVLEMFQTRGKHVLTTPLEHSSILKPLHYYEKKGYEVEYLSLLPDGTIDLEDFKRKVRNDTVLVTVASVSSELGILQPIKEIGEILKSYPKCVFHVDMTQSVGKSELSLKNVDLASFSAHKFYGPKGIGVLMKRENIELVPLIHGGKSTTPFRSGTPALPLIVSLSKALRLASSNLQAKECHVRILNTLLKEELANISGVYFNSTEKSLPHIFNLSVDGIKPETLVHALEEHDIYVSTKSACSSSTGSSLSVYSVTGSENRANSSIRISLSHLTTKEEVETFLRVFKDLVSFLRIK